MSKNIRTILEAQVLEVFRLIEGGERYFANEDFKEQVNLATDQALADIKELLEGEAVELATSFSINEKIWHKPIKAIPLAKLNQILGVENG